MRSGWFRKILMAAGALFLVLVVIGVIGAFFMGDREGFGVGDGVGVVEVKGMIVDGQEVVKQLHAFGKDNEVKAVVLRIDSPGGVVGPSQEIYAAVKRLAAKKKVVASMGSLAASGGYYIAAPATLIYANPGTITGSIGVLMKFSNLEGLMGKVGVKAFTLKSGRFKDVGSPARAMLPDERAMLEGVIGSTYGQFVRAVAEGRRLPVGEVQRLADGRIYSGEQALALKLVDRLGTLQDAVEEAGRLGGITGEPRVIKPPKKRSRPWDLLVEGAVRGMGAATGQGQGMSLEYSLATRPMSVGYLP